ncbi:MAG TPA: glycosyltransferase [Candidatus Binatia bacterium]
MAGPAHVCAVVVHYGDPALTRRCLDSLSGLDEVVLIDQPPRLAGDHPRVTRRIETAKNIGFAAACNRGVDAAAGPFVLLLNNDAVLADGAAAALRRALATLDENVAGLCLKLLDLDGVTIQSAGGLWFSRDGIGFPRGFGELDRGQYDRLDANEIGVPSGAAAVYRTSAWKQAGGMSEEFFCYCEDGDLGLRMIASGNRFAWAPDVKVLHELSSASSAHSLFKAYHVERNHFATMLHCAPVATLLALPFWTAARILGLASDALTGHGAGAGLRREASPLALASTLLRAWAGALVLLPGALATRRALLARHRRAPRIIGRFLATHRTTLEQLRRSRD